MHCQERAYQSSYFLFSLQQNKNTAFVCCVNIPCIFTVEVSFIWIGFLFLFLLLFISSLPLFTIQDDDDDDDDDDEYLF